MRSVNFFPLGSSFRRSLASSTISLTDAYVEAIAACVCACVFVFLLYLDSQLAVIFLTHIVVDRRYTHLEVNALFNPWL